MLLQRLSTSFLRAPLKPLHFHSIPPLATRFQLRSLSTLPRLPIFEAIANHDPNSTVVIHSTSGRKFSYGELLQDVALAKDKLAVEAGGKRLEGERIAFLAENGYDYVVTLLSILSTHSIALPLSPAFPAQELKYILDNSGASMVLSTPKFGGKAGEVMELDLKSTPKHVQMPKLLGSDGSKGDEKVVFQGPADGKGGMMLYTSGTTNRPKGVFLPLAALTAQSHSLIKAWDYSPSDHLLHVLPLHHIHGTVNALLAPLFAGSTIEFLFPFNPASVWARFAAPFMPSPSQNQITLFTAVPTVYTRLLSAFPALPASIQQPALLAITPRHLRLNISGSAALPTPTKSAWTSISDGNVLLERYGMTEVGMALSCGLDIRTRVDGSVGFPLPGVEVRLVDTETGAVIHESEDLNDQGKERDGEIQLRGPTIFKEYWGNPEATAKEFVLPEAGDEAGGPWFKTGDVAVRRAPLDPDIPIKQDWAHGPMYHILGRLSSDIIKTGGEKVSALEVERELLSLPNIAEAAVIAVPSDKWGQKVGAVVMLKEGEEGWSPMDMRRALRDRLAAYKIPMVLKVVKEIERNAMGKINKKELVKKLFPKKEES